MQQSNAPTKLTLAFAANGGKNTIPTASSPTPGLASFNDGFPPLTRTPKTAGGIPPAGLDMNGVLYSMSAINKWNNAGAGYTYDSAFANDSNVGGYPKGARLLTSDGLGYWQSTAENNTADPEGANTNWIPAPTYSVQTVAMSNANVTLTPLQAAKSAILITGTLSASLNLVLPAWAGAEWTIINNSTGQYTVTIKTAGGSGVLVSPACRAIVYCDGTNILYASPSLGYGQTYTNVAGSRAVNTTYFNASGNTIFVMASLLSTASPCQVDATVTPFGGSSYGITGSSAFAVNSAMSIAIAVPPSGSYNLTVNNGVGSVYKWIELR